MTGPKLPSDRRQRIRQAFSAAADTYEAQAQAQARAAAQLAARLPPLPPGARVLEVGCGTGLLTRHLLAALPSDGRLLATDLSAEMIATAGAAIIDPRLALAVMDAEAPDLPEHGFDLIATSLAAQWFADLPAALGGLTRLLAPGGTLMVGTLGAATFREWRAAHAAQGEVSGVPDYPDAANLAAMLPGADVARERFTLDYPDARAFLRSLAAIGAVTPRPGHAPLPPGRLRRIMARLGAPCAITWDILILSYHKGGINA